MVNVLLKLSALATVIALSGCGGGSGGGGSTGSSVSSGQLSLGITDGPVENASEVVVSFTSVELQGPERKLIEFEEAKTLNLLALQGEDRSLLLDGESLESGDYQWIRLGVNEADSYIVIDGSQYPLEIPSSAQTGLKLNRGFTIGAGSTNDFTIDFDLRKSVHQEGTGDYKLRPTLRLVDNLEVNTVNGTVAEALVIDADCNNGDNSDTGNAVYLFNGSDSFIQDIQGNDADPMTSATVAYNPSTELYEFTIGYVSVGDYTVAFTCDALLDINTEDNTADNNEDNDVVSFSAGVNLSVTTGDDRPTNIE
ncbi:MAG: DUF4382 domain-containing protein [Oceanicoccus sp.]